MCPVHTRGHLLNSPPAYGGAETQVRMSKGPGRGLTGQPPQTRTHASGIVLPAPPGGPGDVASEAHVLLRVPPPRSPPQAVPGVHTAGRAQFRVPEQAVAEDGSHAGADGCSGRRDST